MRLTYQLTFRQHYRVTAERMQVARRRRWPMMAARAIALPLIGLLGLMPWLGHSMSMDPLESAIISLVYLLIALLLLPEVLALLGTVFARRELGPTIECTAELTDEGVAMSTPKGNVVFQWESITATQLMKHNLFFNAAQFWYAIPNHAFSSPEAVKEAAHFIEDRRGWSRSVSATAPHIDARRAQTNPYAAPRATEVPVAPTRLTPERGPEVRARFTPRWERIGAVTLYTNIFRQNPRSLLPMASMLGLAALAGLLLVWWIGVVIAATLVLAFIRQMRLNWLAMPRNEGAHAHVIDFTATEIRSWTAKHQSTWPWSVTSKPRETDRAFLVTLGSNRVLYLEKQDAERPADVEALRSLLA